MNDLFFNELVAILGKQDLQKWRVRSITTHRKEFYLMQNRGGIIADQVRSVEDTKYSVMVAVGKSDQLIGAAEAPILPSKDINKSIHNLIEKARLSEEKAWQLSPKSQGLAPKPQSAYQPFFKDFDLSAQLLLDKFRGQIEADKRGIFNSAELFVSKISERTCLSSGFDESHLRSKIYAEVCFSSDSSADAQEYLIYKVGAHPEQVDFKGLIDTSVNLSQQLSHAVLPAAGTYAVMVDAEVLGQLVFDSVHHLEADQKYHKLPFLEKGSDFIKGFSGMPFELHLNPTVEYLSGSRLYDGYGDPQAPLALVRNNKVEANLVSQQMSQYLDLKKTSSLGNVQITTEGEDPSVWRAQRPVLEILQFSGLFSNARDLSFSSEIRLGRLWTPGQDKPRYVKGGSLSGKFQDNFQRIRFSKTKVSVNLNEEALGYAAGYQGPEHALLSDVVISS